MLEFTSRMRNNFQRRKPFGSQQKTSAVALAALSLLSYPRYKIARSGKGIALAMQACSRKLISVVTPCFNEEDNVQACYERVRGVFEQELTAYDYEHLFCDNDSRDRTVAMLRELAEQDPRVKVILNARNFGPIASNFNGMIAAQGDAVLLCLPADLQDPPEAIPEFVAAWEQGFEVVYGRKTKREEGLFMRCLRATHYRLSASCSFVDIPVDVGLFQLVDRVVVDVLRAADDHFPYVQGLVAHAGFRHTFVNYTWKRRERSFSKATWAGLIDQGLNGLTAFSRVPARAILYLGLMFIALAMLLCGVVLATDWFTNHQFDWPVLPWIGVGMLLFSGIHLFALGLLGEYITAIHFQVRKRPHVVERERLNFAVPRCPPTPIPPPHAARITAHAP
jgi:glycosyltransferase involved in cell wall biosynthesis